jgi:hypothetical protein
MNGLAIFKKLYGWVGFGPSRPPLPNIRIQVVDECYAAERRDVKCVTHY